MTLGTVESIYIWNYMCLNIDYKQHIALKKNGNLSIYSGHEKYLMILILVRPAVLSRHDNSLIILILEQPAVL